MRVIITNEGKQIIKESNINIENNKSISVIEKKDYSQDNKLHTNNLNTSNYLNKKKNINCSILNRNSTKYKDKIIKNNKKTVYFDNNNKVNLLSFDNKNNIINNNISKISLKPKKLNLSKIVINMYNTSVNNNNHNNNLYSTKSLNELNFISNYKLNENDINKNTNNRLLTSHNECLSNKYFIIKDKINSKFKCNVKNSFIKNKLKYIEKNKNDSLDYNFNKERLKNLVDKRIEHKIINNNENIKKSLKDIKIKLKVTQDIINRYNFKLNNKVNYRLLEIHEDVKSKWKINNVCE